MWCQYNLKQKKKILSYIFNYIFCTGKLWPACSAWSWISPCDPLSFCWIIFLSSFHFSLFSFSESEIKLHSAIFTGKRESCCLTNPQKEICRSNILVCIPFLHPVFLLLPILSASKHLVTNNTTEMDLTAGDGAKSAGGSERECACVCVLVCVYTYSRTKMPWLWRKIWENRVNLQWVSLSLQMLHDLFLAKRAKLFLLIGVNIFTC